MNIFCYGCYENKHIKEFTKSSIKGNYPNCKNCCSLNSKKKKYKKRKPSERNKAFLSYYRRRLTINKKFNLTTAELMEMMDNQKGCCLICGKSLDNKNGRYCIDHCHNSGKVRGLLCVKCNSGLGMFNDNLNIIKNAVEYLTTI